ncbi:MAG: hypothetical protein IKP40_13485 [Clostridia bacterium]|nr:hypothetical protein [Clostridia bacterium]
MYKQQNVRLEADGSIRAFDRVWRFDSQDAPSLVLSGGETVLFSSAVSVQTRPVTTGLGQGSRTVYADLPGCRDFTFETETLVSDTDGHVDFTFSVQREMGLRLREVRYPAPVAADDSGAYAVLNTMQGQLLPVDWPQKLFDKLPFDGQMCSESAYMPWWGEVTPTGSYLAWVRSPWDTKYSITHPAGGPTRIQARHLPSLGNMRYQRTVSFFFLPAGSNYLDLCRLYRKLAEEEGKPVTLREKAARNPNVARLKGCCVMHVAGKTHVSPDSRYYHQDDPSRNETHVPFAHWEERARRLKEMGVDRLYMHQDGWGQPGYDNQHPDYLPPCRELGGWEGMRKLSETVEELGYLYGVHDQYRDYYLDAPTYTPDCACRSADGSIYGHAIWAGGKQNYLCASLAPGYVKRNFEQLLAGGIRLQATYLDVFTCNEADECDHPRHRMTRRECLEYRARCFHYLTSKGIAPSSEEVNDWAMDSQVFCHWAPYLTDTAIAVPLFNLVYHDCVMIPWKMEAGEWGIPEGTTGFLHCLLNGGMPYMSDQAEGEALEENIRQWKVISELHLHVADEKMTDHRFLTEDRQTQRTAFSDGTSVTVCFSDGRFEICYPDGRKVTDCE